MICIFKKYVLLKGLMGMIEENGFDGIYMRIIFYVAMIILDI